MFRPAFLLALPILAFGSCQPPTTVATRDARNVPDTLAIRGDVEHLASAALEGRGTGTAGNDSAAAYIARRFESLDLATLPNGCEDSNGVLQPRCERKYFQPFIARSAARSEEHTSELQSLAYLVCRLLFDKK